MTKTKSAVAVAVVSTLAFMTTPVLAVDLVGVHDLAFKYDAALQASAYRRDATSENDDLARAFLLPQIGGSADLNQGDSETFISGVSVSDEDVDTQSWGLGLNQSVYDHANWERLAVAKGTVSRGEAYYQIAYQEFLVRVAASYFDVLTAQDGVITAEAEERALQRQFEQAEQRFEVGLTAVTDVYEARASYDNARARAIVARNTLADAREALRELTGEYFETLDPLQETLPLVRPDPDSDDEWVRVALASNPAVIAARYGVQIAEDNTDLQRAGHYPTLSLNAGYNEFTNNKLVLQDDFQNPIAVTDLQNDNLYYGLRLDVPIYQGGAVSARSRQSRYELNATQEDLDQQTRFTERQTRDAFRAVIAGIEQVQAFEQARISANSALEATQAGFEVGTRTIVDVLIAEQRFYQAERDNSTARHTYILDHLRLRAAAGVLSEEDLRKVNEILE